MTTNEPLWHGQAHMPTVARSRRVIARGDGVHVWDEDGHRVLDLPASLWYCAVGHGRGEIADAASAQLRTLAAYSNFQSYATRPALELAGVLADAAPMEQAKVFLTSGGSDAVDLSVKLARRYWSAVERPRKRTIVTRERSYHGLHGFGTSISGLDVYREGIDRLLPDAVRVPYDDWRAFERLLADGGSEHVAAFVCEPVIGSGGVLHAPDDYFANVRRLCDEHDVLFVADEVIAGFGRLGTLFASERFGLRPDILLFAKGVSSGYLPLGGVLVAGRVAAPFWDEDSTLVLRHGLTYQAHATACAAGLANLAIIEREGLVARARELETTLASVLRPLERHPLVEQVRVGEGLLAGVVVRDAATAGRVSDDAWERGLLARQIGDGDVLQVSPPLTISPEQLAEAAELLAASLDDVLATVPGAAA
ncbi:aminotransferase family protein [Conexibacter woesei]|uniref:Aminotransferase class-III n=1 Tax=Conexibacter woesei (strain DSM 14684 / CCUG 47730 / CIP 108061 / JCM 11494 / NBRC 100937 / ID131577) TaxID=469383 RepID=D3F6F3_CONWI|nr:aminotransferase class III-fold pyridoxal phosphate-dependent enzyme [Conexibacter woesei]ADB50720.1 aminotransferase class-III [Conexibacter woesei DSM 14684]